MTIYGRLAVYAVSIVVLTVAITCWQVESSRANLVNDRSSMAWVGFLPFIIPIFAGYASVVVGAVAVVVEIVLAVWRRR